MLLSFEYRITRKHSTFFQSYSFEIKDQHFSLMYVFEFNGGLYKKTSFTLCQDIVSAYFKFRR